MTEFRKWKSIEKFSDAYFKAQKFATGKFTFRSKIKLHGTNAGIHIEAGEVLPMKRTSFISVENDNCGFARFVSELNIDPIYDIIIYGEWAGPGIQKNDAVASIPEKTFFVFSIFDLKENEMIVEPDELDTIMKAVVGPSYQDQRIRVIPWHSEPMTINFTDQADCQAFIDSVMKEVDEVIAEEDPYIKKEFGVSGPGEGLVIYGIEGYQLNGDPLETEIVLDYIFKAKTESHTVQKSKDRNHVAPEKPEGVEDFIESFFTEARFEQMLNEIGGEATRQKTGDFMKAVMSDVHKESKNEIEVASFEWKDVPKYAAPRVKVWWFDKCDQL